MLARSGVGKARRVAARNEVWFQVERWVSAADRVRQAEAEGCEQGARWAPVRARQSTASSLIARAKPSAVPCRAGRFVCVCAGDDGVSTVEYGAGAIVPPPEGRHAVPPEDELSGAMRAPDFRGMITSPGAVSVPTKGTPTKGTPRPAQSGSATAPSSSAGAVVASVCAGSLPPLRAVVGRSARRHRVRVRMGGAWQPLAQILQQGVLMKYCRFVRFLKQACPPPRSGTPRPRALARASAAIEAIASSGRSAGLTR